MFLGLLAIGEIVDGHYPGGASAGDPVPVDIAYYTSPVGYGLFAVAVLAALLFAITRLNIDR